MGRPGQVVLLIDGAARLENMGDLNFPKPFKIVDFYHAVEHAGQVVKALVGSKELPEYEPRRSRWVRRLLGNSVENLIKETRQECAGKPQAQAVEEELKYFVNNEQCNTGPFVGRDSVGRDSLSALG